MIQQAKVVSEWSISGICFTLVALTSSDLVKPFFLGLPPLSSVEDNIQKMLWMCTQIQPPATVCFLLTPASSSFSLFLFSGIQSDLDQQLVEEKQEMLCQMMQEKAAFVFGKQGCLTDTELHTVLKVRMCMTVLFKLRLCTAQNPQTVL